VVVTGVGLVTPAGVGRKAFDDYLENGHSCLQVLKELLAQGCPVSVGGVIPDFCVTDYVPNRLAKRCDRFTHLALGAADLALKDARLDLAREDRERIGILLGNNLGGWAFGQQGLYDLYRTGAASISPYQATAWFPGAPQGQISICHGLKGYSKTVIADRASGLVAIAAAVRTIRLGHCDVVLAGGTEAPIAPYSMICYLSGGQVSLATDPATAFLPFDTRRSGIVLSEGSALLVLEERSHAMRRGATLLGEIVSYGVTGGAAADPMLVESPEPLTRAMQSALSQAEWQAETVDYVCADGSGIGPDDRAEMAAISRGLGSASESVAVSSAKGGIGHMLGAAGAADVYAALCAIGTGRISPTVGQDNPDPICNLQFVTKSARRAPVRKALVNAQGRGGTAVCLAIAAA
jgi:3-oxoacyl-[acyl-carrier-protein] synthase II